MSNESNIRIIENQQETIRELKAEIDELKIELSVVKDKLRRELDKGLRPANSFRKRIIKK